MEAPLVRIFSIYHKNCYSILAKEYLGNVEAVMKKAMYQGNNSKQVITIYNAAGIKISEVRVCALSILL